MRSEKEILDDIRTVNEEMLDVLESGPATPESLMKRQALTVKFEELHEELEALKQPKVPTEFYAEYED